MSGPARSLAEVRRLVAALLPGVPAGSLVALGEGTDHAAYLLDGRLVVRIDRAGDPAAVAREARLLDAVAAISPLPVPRPVLVAAADGCLVYERLPGTSLLDAPVAARAAHGRSVAVALGSLLATLRATPPEALAGLVDRDDEPPQAWLDEAKTEYARCAAAVPPEHRAGVEAFLAAGAPAAAPTLAFSHNDLGIEHVLVDPATWTVSGILDWADAAIADPARDFGLLYRDLGPAALEVALGADGGAEDLRERARFYARCGLLEDLAYGLETDKPRYVEKSLAGLAWLFGT